MKSLLNEYVNFLISEESGGGAGGVAYEKVIFDAIRAANASGNQKTPAGNDKNLPDADITIGGKVYNVEVKMNGNAQMGGGSIGWLDNKFYPAGDSIDQMMPIANKLNASPESRTLNLAIEELCLFLSQKSNRVISGFPASGILKSAWEEATIEKLLVPVNVKIAANIEFIADHYAKKHTHYIQVGGHRLFYLKDNPANLPIPRLEGLVTLEIRAARAGSGGRPTVSAGIRVQSRLITHSISDYTLDDVESIKSLLALHNT